ncbi:pseudouridylate synthase 7 homolog [Ornithodoros turicata]|uniref:pseudouridylate synthase 7 homolog n=1 Tax=Ornithodoros turicata TaxID=34597 RepID=UPI0031392723
MDGTDGAGKRPLDQADTDIKPKKPKTESGAFERHRKFIPSESSVGITEYIGTHKGFTGHLKQRYSDFLVNEIAPSGEVVRLKSFEGPANDAAEEDSYINTTVVSKETLDKMNALVSGDTAGQITIDVTDLSKDERRQVHILVRKKFPDLESQTKIQDSKKIITVEKKENHQGPKRQKYWPHTRGNHTAFTLYKENADTMEAINMIAKVLRYKPSRFTYAGTKDKRAKTCQMVSIYRVPASHLVGLNKRQWNIAIGDVHYREKEVKLGDLSGNRFGIVLRGVSGSKEDIEDAVASLSQKGFINYFGLQRFGTTSVSTHDIGRALLKEQYEEAVNLILKPRDGGGGRPDLAACREEWQRSKDPQKALEHLKRKCILEGLLLQGLISSGVKAWSTALYSIPRNTRLMYVHSYQSFVWNRVVSRRLQKFGLAVLEGDLILNQSECVPEEVMDKRKATPSVVSDISSCSIQEVVLPLPGYNVNFPKNEIADWYKEILAEEGLTVESLKTKNKSYSLSGCYRHIVVVPHDMTWSEVRYSTIEEPVVLSDYDILKGHNLPEGDENEDCSSKMRGLKIEFSLPPSSYATMAIRELTKSDTSVWSNETPKESSEKSEEGGEEENGEYDYELDTSEAV